MQNKKYFLNLTNGIEALKRYNISLNDIQFLRIQSTHLENEAFDKLLLTLDSNFLMWLALGYECVIYDFGAKSETSKAMYYGVEWIKYVLNIRWFGNYDAPIVKGKNVKQQFAQHYNNIDKKTKKQIDYYKKFLLTNQLNITSITSLTNNDNQPDFYLNILKRNKNY